jgi:ubiquinone/menaquinone biosynthesis C-methylase UbiE
MATLSTEKWPEKSRAIVRSSDDGVVEIRPAAAGRLRISLHPRDPQTGTELANCETSLPLELVEFLISKYPFGSLCAYIVRQEDPEQRRLLQRQLFAHVRPSEFRGRKLLDFGCGSGASTFALASLLPQTEIFGVDLSADRIAAANKTAEVLGVRNTRFMVSPSGDSIPSGIGPFDFVTLNAVYEHLLPEERKLLMPLLWSVMKPGAVLFINQTPYRYFPYEHHSTGLWFINYLPDRLAHLLARRFARIHPHINRSPKWEELLRAGIRGATEPEIIRNLCANGGKAVILQPKRGRITDRASYWLASTGPGFRAVKKGIAQLFRISDRLFGTIPSTNVEVAIRKEA